MDLFGAFLTIIIIILLSFYLLCTMRKYHNVKTIIMRIRIHITAKNTIRFSRLLCHVSHNKFCFLHIESSAQLLKCVAAFQTSVQCNGSVFIEPGSSQNLNTDPSVSDPYLLNPDPAENLNADPEYRYRYLPLNPDQALS